MKRRIFSQPWFWLALITLGSAGFAVVPVLDSWADDQAALTPLLDETAIYAEAIDPEASLPTQAVAPALAPDDCRQLLRSSSKVAAWNPPGRIRVGLQAGHWRTGEAPDELARLRSQTGSSAGGYAEWQLNLDIGQRTAALLNPLGIEVDILPTTIPPCYRAHAFVSIHGDGDLTGMLNGFKVARASGSLIPAVDDALVAAMNEQYGLATGLRRDDEHISRRMLYYYAFNSRRQAHAISPDVPAVIIETGFITNASDRHFLTTYTDRVAAGLANGILRFLGLPDRIPLL